MRHWVCPNFRVSRNCYSRRDKVASIYRELLRDVPEAKILSPVEGTTRLSWFILPVRLEETIDRDKLINLLRSRGVPSRAYFSPIYLQPYFEKQFNYKKGNFPIAERVANSTLALPFYSNISQEEIEYVVTCLKAAIPAAAA